MKDLVQIRNLLDEIDQELSKLMQSKMKTNRIYELRSYILDRKDILIQDLRYYIHSNNASQLKAINIATDYRIEN